MYFSHEVLEYFVFSFAADFGEIIKDYIEKNKILIRVAFLHAIVKLR